VEIAIQFINYYFLNDRTCNGNFLYVQSVDKFFLISDNYQRTQKYFLALAAGIPCISYMWIHHSCSAVSMIVIKRVFTDFVNLVISRFLVIKLNEVFVGMTSSLS
jgi:hypothetical protein